MKIDMYILAALTGFTGELDLSLSVINSQS